MSTPAETVLLPKRLMSVDALRGFDMFWIAGGGAVIQRAIELFWRPIPHFLEFHFEHVPWEGFAAWDLIMPLFLFITGVSLPFSLSRRGQEGQSTKTLYLHAARRVLILWILGMVAQGNLLTFNPSEFHLYSNTLQAIAIGYFVATIALLHLRVAGQAALIFVLVAVYWALMTFVPVPGIGAGVLTEEGNLAYFIDVTVLGPFKDHTHYTWIVSSINFAATVLLGVMGGHILRLKETAPGRKALCLLALGIGGVVLGLLTGLFHPIIKHIWTSSFVFFSGGLCFLLLAFFYWVVDVLEYRRWTFLFTVMGMNALVTYMVSEFLSIGVLEHVLGHGERIEPGPMVGFSLAVVVFACVWLLLYVMYKKRWFVKI